MCPADGAASTTNAGDLCRKIFRKPHIDANEDLVESIVTWLSCVTAKHTFDLCKVCVSLESRIFSVCFTNALWRFA